MEFGIFAGFNTREGRSQADAFDEWLALAQVAEDVGIDCFWLAEFHFRPRTIVSAPLKSPTIFGLKPISTWQLCPGCRFDGQRLLSVNGPLSAMLEIDTTALPVSRSVTTNEVAPVLSVRLPKSTLDGMSSTATCVPVPLSAAVAGAAAVSMLPSGPNPERARVDIRSAGL